MIFTIKVLGGAGRPSHTSEFECEDRAEALRILSETPFSDVVELWDGATLLWRSDVEARALVRRRRAGVPPGPPCDHPVAYEIRCFAPPGSPARSLVFHRDDDDQAMRYAADLNCCARFDLWRDDQLVSRFGAAEPEAGRR